MKIRPLPLEIQALLQAVGAPPRLIAHLTVVHDVAITITNKVATSWPSLQFDRQAILIGAATHDTGKVAHPEELTGPGNQHEVVGPDLLIQSGLPAQYARFARTHGRWSQDEVVIEDLLVALADTIWKGARNVALETRLSEMIAAQSDEALWQVYMKMDDIISAVAEDSNARVIWQGHYAATV